jgi:putative ABC transport system permease protein
MAVRNIQRHKRRTLFTFLVLSVSAGVYIFYTCLLDGFNRQSFENMITFESGHIRIAHPGEDNDPLSLSNCLSPAQTAAVRRAVAALPQIKAVVPRLHFQAEIDNMQDSAPCRITGLDPRDDGKVFPLHRMTRLQTLSSNTAILGFRLARDMKVGVGDSFFLTFRKEAGMLESMSFTVGALVTSGYPDIDGGTVLLSLATTRHISAATGPSELNLLLYDPDTVLAVRDALRAALPGLLVQSWQDTGSGIAAISNTKEKASGVLVLFLAGIALVGIINTMLMSVLEKRQEIGTLKAWACASGTCAGFSCSKAPCWVLPAGLRACCWARASTPTSPQQAWICNPCSEKPAGSRSSG